MKHKCFVTNSRFIVWTGKTLKPTMYLQKKCKMLQVYCTMLDYIELYLYLLYTNLSHAGSVCVHCVCVCVFRTRNYFLDVQQNSSLDLCAHWVLGLNSALHWKAFETHFYWRLDKFKVHIRWHFEPECHLFSAFWNNPLQKKKPLSGKIHAIHTYRYLIYLLRISNWWLCEWLLCPSPTVPSHF